MRVLGFVGGGLGGPHLLDLPNAREIGLGRVLLQRHPRLMRRERPH